MLQGVKRRRRARKGGRERGKEDERMRKGGWSCYLSPLDYPQHSEEGFQSGK